MRQLVCVVEGHGENLAAPALCGRILRDILGGHAWCVQQRAIRLPRSELVDGTVPSPSRPFRLQSIERVAGIALSRRADGVIVLCDADDDCPAQFGRTAPRELRRRNVAIAIRAVMVNREFESWFLWNQVDSRTRRPLAADPERLPRDAKGAMRRLDPAYTPTTHQLAYVHRLDLLAVWSCSPSFDKLVRSIAEIIRRDPPARPSRP